MFTRTELAMLFQRKKNMLQKPEFNTIQLASLVSAETHLSCELSCAIYKEKPTDGTTSKTVSQVPKCISNNFLPVQ